jgi:hypothetical protein
MFAFGSNLRHYIMFVQRLCMAVPLNGYLLVKSPKSYRVFGGRGTFPFLFLLAIVELYTIAAYLKAGCSTHVYRA